MYTTASFHLQTDSPVAEGREQMVMPFGKPDPSAMPTFTASGRLAGYFLTKKAP